MYLNFKLEAADRIIIGLTRASSQVHILWISCSKRVYQFEGVNFIHTRPQHMTPKRKHHQQAGISSTV